MAEPESIYKGDTAGPWNVGVPDDNGDLITINAPWSCKIKVSGTAIDRVVTDKTADNKRFIAALTPSETDTLSAGSQYVVAIEIENTATTPPLRREHHIILTVKEQVVGSIGTVEPPTRLDRLKQHYEALLDAKDEAVGGVVQEVWNGRYGNKMKYMTMSYQQICDALDRVTNEIANEERIAAGGSRRGGGVGIVWGH